MKSKTIILALAMSCLILIAKFSFSYKSGKPPEKLTESQPPVKVYRQSPVDQNPGNIGKKMNFSNVVGSWKSEEDENWQFIFLSNGTCIERYVGSSSDTSNYSISNTTPQCGVIVPIDQTTEYLKLSFPADSSKNNCYLLNGTTDSTLSISPLESYKVFMFRKQQ
ncbi:hypothetical protein [Pedobacter sp. KBW01]|uniref:hypothetical protein n=1 Tax=Pedobacter sp. KBW01 TaxID=2153364 RepID=UPI000F5B70EB|nr:hypothetical protein [Pedobacter sp. KBW01]